MHHSLRSTLTTWCQNFTIEHATASKVLCRGQATSRFEDHSVSILRLSHSVPFDKDLRTLRLSLDLLGWKY
jgi:hypothetical protein